MFRLIFCLFLFAVNLAPARAVIMVNEKLNHIAELPAHLSDVEEGKGVVLFDWDYTLGIPNGEKLRDKSEKNGSRPIIKRLYAKGYRTAILTSKMRGIGKAGGTFTSNRWTDDGWAKQFSVFLAHDVEEEADGYAATFRKLLKGIAWEDHLALKEPVPEEPYHDFPLNCLSKSTEGSAIRRALYGMLGRWGIIYAGGDYVKGIATAMLIDSEMFATRPEVVVFVDDLKENTEEFAKAFADRPEKVYIFHYPYRPGRN